MTDQNIQDRVNRAQSQTMELTLVDTEPFVVQVANEESDRVHTVVPESVHCSCEDHTYRGYICKHIISVLQTEDQFGELMEEELKEHRAELESEANEAKERLDDLLFQCHQITDVFSELNIDQSMESTDKDAMRLLQKGVEARDAAIVENNPVDQSSEEARSEFEELVADLTAQGEGS